MDIAYKSSYRQIFPIIIGGAGLCCVLPNANADVTFDGTLGPGGTLDGSMMEITADRGQMAGNNLFHSFSEFNVNTGQTANFSGPDNVQNIFGRVTGSNPSTIDGIISSSIPGANLFLMNPNGMMFGPSAQINLSGSFHATTADYLSFGNQERFYADINQNTTLSVAAPIAFGFLDNAVSGITIDGSELSVTDGNEITINAGDIEITNGGTVIAPDGIINVSSVKSAGEIATDQKQTDFDAFSELGPISINNVSTVSASGAFGGRIVIRGGQLTVDASSVSADTEIYATQLEPNIDIETRNSVAVDNGGKISADLKMFADGKPTGIQINTGHLTVHNSSAIQSLAEFLSFGNAGNINVNAKHILLINYSQINTSTSSTGDSGDVSINNAESLDITNASSVKTAADWLFGEGESGNVTIDADYISISGLEDPLDPDIFDFTGIDTGFSILTGNNAGDIQINTRNLSMANNAQIRSVTFGTYRSGDITINSDYIDLNSGSSINTGSVEGISGNIIIENGNEIVVQGTSPFANAITGNYRRSNIISDSGEGAKIAINSDSIRILDGGLISSRSSASIQPVSGNIELDADFIQLSGYSSSIYESALQSGYTADEALDQAQSKITSSARSELLLPVDSASAGTIALTANTLLITDHAAIEAEAIHPEYLNSGQSGDIDILAENITLANAELSARTTQSNGGNITVTGEKSLVITNSSVSSAVDSEAGNGGNINISSKLLLINNSQFYATAYQGNGGNINVSANKLVLTNNNVFDASSELSIDGNISITSEELINDQLIDLPVTMTDPSIFFKDPCAAANQNIFSTLTTTTPLLLFNHSSINRVASEYYGEIEHDTFNSSSTFLGAYPNVNNITPQEAIKLGDCTLRYSQFAKTQ